MIYGSICSGIEAASVALHPLGWRPAFLSEIDAFPRAVLSHHYPNVPLHGDFTTIREGDYAAIDVLVGGTPCQSFSIAGLRAGLDDERGNLALEFCRLARRLGPRWVVWENVPGVLSLDGGRAFASILGGLAECGYGLAYRVLDAQFVRVDGFGRAVPQRRRRVFVVGHLGGDWRRAAAVLFERASLSGHPPPRREAGQDAARPLAGCTPGGSGYRNDADTADNLVAHTLNAKGGAGRSDSDSETFLPVAHALRADGFDAGEDGTARRPARCEGEPALATWRVRRLMVEECEFLQGFPRGYTAIPYRGKPAADGPRYKALGNSMAVNVMRWLGLRIQMVEDLSRG